MSFSPAAVWPVVMLFASNIFMTFAWYGHLKHKSSAIFLAIIVSWGIAFFEYCLAVLKRTASDRRSIRRLS